MAEREETQEERLQGLRRKLADLKARWPAHSVKPDLIHQLESLEEEIAFLEAASKQK